MVSENLEAQIQDANETVFCSFLWLQKIHFYSGGHWSDKRVVPFGVFMELALGVFIARRANSVRFHAS